MSRPDWERFTARYWRQQPVLIPAETPPLALDALWRLIVQAAEPFRDGTRFFTLPDVSYHEPDGQLRAPGAALPSDTDQTVDSYQQRLSGRSHHLVVSQPFHLDVDLWNQVRGLLTPLWRLTGVPIAPVLVQLIVSDGYDEAWRDSNHDVFSWVLTGSLQSGDLNGSAGDLLYWPAEHGPGAIHAKGCLALRILVPTDARSSTVVRETIEAILQRRRESERVPYLPYDSAGSVMVPLERLATELAEVVAGPDLARQLRIRWAKRVSAAALEPVPPPRDDRLEPGLLVEPASPIVRLPEQDGSWIWASNGHAFTVRGGAGDRVIEQLRSGRVHLEDDPLLPLYRKLYSLRAVDVAEGKG